MPQVASTGGQNAYVWRNCCHGRWVLAELLAMLVESDVRSRDQSYVTLVASAKFLVCLHY